MKAIFQLKQLHSHLFCHEIVLIELVVIKDESAFDAVTIIYIP